ncbi:MAG TPA: hypothetical protein VGR35_19210 [Tepidisphaeraceae bacterium]|nr:hypothetical protein [Tepidisphaeraceae bacterium]
MVALAVEHQMRSSNMRSSDAPSAMPGEEGSCWGMRVAVMRHFPRLAVEPTEEPTVDARWDEEPERWDGMA